MKYLYVLAEAEGAGPAPGSEEFAQMLKDYATVTQQMRQAGILVDGGPLQGPSSATTVRVRDGERTIFDGPYAEIKEQLGGYYVLNCTDLDEALEWAAKLPAARYGSVEVRPLAEIPR